MRRMAGLKERLKVGGWWRLGCPDGNEEAGRERREIFDGKDDRESQMSQAGFRSTVTVESVKVRDAGQKRRACYSTKIVEGRGALDVRSILSQTLSLFLEKLTIFGLVLWCGRNTCI